jgi:hypothetical protein
MKLSIQTGCAMLCALAISAAQAQTKPANPAIPHLEKRGLATQLIVDGKQFLVLGAEPPTSATSNLEYLRYMMQVMADTGHQNSAAIAIGWSWIEPEKGKYDFRIVDAMIKDARQTHLRIVLVWFGSWKNGLSSFAPAWVKADQDQFPRAQMGDGRSLETLSTFSANNWEADARAFAALMRHIREVDQSHQVILVQVENEIGILGDTRDRSPQANQAFAAPIPAELMDYLNKHKDELLPELRTVWEAAGFKTSGTWEDVFGKGPKTDEIFMSWNYARYVNRVTEAGKKEYPIPMFVNVWLGPDWGLNGYPRGEAEDHVQDIWRVGAPSVDMFCPDAYLSSSATQGVADAMIDLTKRYTRSGNIFFTVEANSDSRGAAHAFYAIGQHRAIGYTGMGEGGLLDWFTKTGMNMPAVVTPPGAGSPETLYGFGGPGSSKPLPPPPPEYEQQALSQAFLVLSQIAPQILAHQTNGTIAGVALDDHRTSERVKLGNYILNVGFPTGRRAPDVAPEPVGYGLFMEVGPDEYLLAGNNLLITFTPDTPGPPIAGLAVQEAGRFDANGKWVATHFLGGDDTVISSDPPAMNQSGSGVRLVLGERAVQRVKLYRYK